MSSPAKYRENLPQLTDPKKLCLVDGGLETSLVFDHGVDLPVFGSFMELRSEEGTKRVVDWFEKFAQLAVDNKMNFMIETPTWRASRDWAAKVYNYNFKYNL
jgi:homocysteine S-methyltransferase